MWPPRWNALAISLRNPTDGGNTSLRRALVARQVSSEGFLAMRLAAIIAGIALTACTTSDITVPSDPVLREVPSPTVSSSGGGNFISTIESSLASPGVVNPGAPPQGATPLDADTLNLTLYTIEQQKIDARIAEQQLADARSRLVIVQPSAVPNQAPGVNIALYAQNTSNAVGERRYRRGVGASIAGGGCRRYGTPDEAQRAFLAGGGPQSDPMNLDADGDGFACGWDPTPYRQLRL